MPVRASGASEDLLGRVEDPAVRAEVLVLMSEIRSLRARNASLLSAFRRLQPLGRITAEMAHARVEDLEALAAALEKKIPPDGVSFSPAEIADVESFLAGLPKEGLVIDESSGEIVTMRHGRCFARAGVTSALRKVAAARR